MHSRGQLKKKKISRQLLNEYEKIMKDRKEAEELAEIRRSQKI